MSIWNFLNLNLPGLLERLLGRMALPAPRRGLERALLGMGGWVWSWWMLD